MGRIDCQRTAFTGYGANPPWPKSRQPFAIFGYTVRPVQAEKLSFFDARRSYKRMIAQCVMQEGCTGAHGANQKNIREVSGGSHSPIQAVARPQAPDRLVGLK
jgi:hypothetical protein